MPVAINDLVYWAIPRAADKKQAISGPCPPHWLIGKVHEITGRSPNKECAVVVLRSSKSMRTNAIRYLPITFDIREDELTVINEDDMIAIVLTHQH